MLLNMLLSAVIVVRVCITGGKVEEGPVMSDSTCTLI